MNLSTTDAERFWKKVDRSSGPDACWLWTAAQQRGYGAFRISGSGGRHQVNAHRVAYALEFGGLTPKVHVLHACDVPLCCNPKHLSTGSRSDNMADAAAKGRMAGAGGRKIYRLTDEQRTVIRERSLAGDPIRAIARDVGTSAATVRRIARESKEASRESADTFAMAGELGIHLVALPSAPEPGSQ